MFKGFEPREKLPYSRAFFDAVKGIADIEAHSVKYFKQLLAKLGGAAEFRIDCSAVVYYSFVSGHIKQYPANDVFFCRIACNALCDEVYREIVCGISAKVEVSVRTVRSKETEFAYIVGTFILHSFSLL